MWIRRVVLARLAPDIELPPTTELAEVQAMLSGNVIPWNVRAMEKGLQKGLQKGRQEGRQEGLIECRTDLARGTLERQLTRRFGPLQ